MGYTVEKCFYLTSQILLIVYSNYPKFMVALAAIPLFLYTITRCILPSEKKISTEYVTFMDFVTIAWRIFQALQVATMCLKMDGILLWKWNEAFWLYWVLFAFMLGFDIGLILVIANKWLRGMNGVDDSNEMKGLLWILSICLSLTICSAFLILGIIDKLDNYLIEKIVLSFYFTLMCLFLNFVLSMLLANNIMDFFKRVALLEQEDLRRSFSSLSANDIENNIAMPLRIPKFLEKLSNSYFKVVNNEARMKETKQEMTQNPETLPAKEGKPKKVVYKGKKAVIYPKKKPEAVKEKNKPKKPSDKQKFSAFSVTKTHIVPKKQPQPLANENFLERNDEKLKRILSEKAAESRLKIGENPNFSKMGTLEPRIHPEGNKIENPEKITSPMNTNENPVLSPENPGKGRISLREPSLEEENREGTIDHTNPNIDKTEEENDENQNEDIPEENNEEEGEEDKDENNEENKEEKQENNEEVQENQDNKTCLICFDRDGDAVIMDCGHGGICYTCCIEMWKKKQGCYLCRKPILQVLQIDLAKSTGKRIKVLSCTKMKKGKR